MIKSNNSNSGKSWHWLTEAEITDKYCTPTKGNTVGERFAAAFNAFIIEHDDFNIPVDRVRIAGTPMTDEEAFSLHCRRLILAFRATTKQNAQQAAKLIQAYKSENLERIKKDLKSGKKVTAIKVSKLYRWFVTTYIADDQIIFFIHSELTRTNLRTEPYFAEQNLNGAIEFYEGARMTDNEAFWLDCFHATLIKARIIERGGTFTTWADLRNAYNQLMQETNINSFSANEFIAAQALLSEEDFGREGYEPEIAKDLGKALVQYFESLDYAGWSSYLEKVGRPCRAAESEGSAPSSVSSDRRRPAVGSPAEFKQNIFRGPESWWQPSRPCITEEIPPTTFRIRGLEAAHKHVFSVKPNEPIIKAITLMLKEDFPQVPVMIKDTVKGVVSFKSIVSRQLRPGADLSGEVQDYMDKEAAVVDADIRLLDGIDHIVSHQYVLVRDRGKICGIVTHTDLSIELKRRSEPFLLINTTKRL